MPDVNKQFEALISRVATWPEAAQDELMQLAKEIEEDLKSEYQASEEELHAIDEGLEAVRRGEIATDTEVEAVFAKHRSA